jgi:hypothetical protein
MGWGQGDTRHSAAMMPHQAIVQPIASTNGRQLRRRRLAP